MPETLLEAINRYTEAHADFSGRAHPPISGLTLVRKTRSGELQRRILRPLICMIVQGTKQVTISNKTVAFTAGDSMLLTADVPSLTHIAVASHNKPYLALALTLDSALVADLSSEMQDVSVDMAEPMRFQPTNAEVADTALRMMRLLDRPASVPLLQAQLIREMHYWLLAGCHGAAIRQLGAHDSVTRRIALTTKLIRTKFSVELSLEQLASTAGMSLSSFHQHFRKVTSLSPLQFQKQLRLLEARRLMLAEGSSPSIAACAVGYESVPQFTREYRRFFGLPPVREVEAALRAQHAA